MAKERVLITVKTYPTLSRKYGETVCTAGDGRRLVARPSFLFGRTRRSPVGPRVPQAESLLGGGRSDVSWKGIRHLVQTSNGSHRRVRAYGTAQAIPY